MTRSTLLVFDVDGTLITTRAGRKAFNQALERVFGVADAAAGVAMAGRTDPLIYREICEANGWDPGTFGAWKMEFLAALAEHLTHDPGTIHPGVEALLEACSREAGFVLALGTGNVEEGARMKLAPHGLNRYFHTGGFGDDGATRDEVIAKAIARAEAQQGARFDRVLVIGDTPHDIACGRANRCVTVGVATGHHAREELQACGADWVVDDFADVMGAVERFRNL